MRHELRSYVFPYPRVGSLPVRSQYSIPVEPCQRPVPAALRL